MLRAARPGSGRTEPQLSGSRLSQGKGSLDILTSQSQQRQCGLSRCPTHPSCWPLLPVGVLAPSCVALASGCSRAGAGAPVNPQPCLSDSSQAALWHRPLGLPLSLSGSGRGSGCELPTCCTCCNLGVPGRAQPRGPQIGCLRGAELSIASGPSECALVTGRLTQRGRARRLLVPTTPPTLHTPVAWNTAGQTPKASLGTTSLGPQEWS